MPCVNVYGYNYIHVSARIITSITTSFATTIITTIITSAAITSHL